MQAAENYAYSRSDTVISMLPNAEPHMRAHGLAPGKFVYVPNGIDAEEWGQGRSSLPGAVATAIARHRARLPFLIGYAGAHGLANALDALIDAAGIVRHEGVGFVLVGQGPEKSRMRKRAHLANLTNVLFVDALPKNAIPALLDQMDALYIGLQRQPLFRFGVSPNKLMDYMMAGKPVIHAIEAGNDLVEDSGCGISVPPEDADAVAAAARTLIAMPRELRATMGERGRCYVLQHHTYDVLARRFLDALRT
jgi:glycosyltransferase involved in cell wall biosynthesis